MIEQDRENDRQSSNISVHFTPHARCTYSTFHLNMPIAIAAQPKAIKTVLPTLEGITQASFENDGERSKTLLAAYALISRLESPWETICRLAMSQVIV